MAKFAENLYTASGATADFVVSFPFIERSHVSVYLDDVLTTAYTWVDDSNITLDAIPSAGVLVKIVRDSSSSSRLTNFNDGSRLTESDLDQDGDQAFYLIQESRDKIEDVNTIHDDILTDIVTNADNIAANSADIATAEADILINAAEIASNDTDIATNAAGIVTNAADIISGDAATLLAAKVYTDALYGDALSPWTTGTIYDVDDVVEYDDLIYQCHTLHTSGATFDATKFTEISQRLTAAEVKVRYESNADTNALTDALLSKLNAIESGATADQTGAEIKIAYEAELDTNAFTDADHSKLDGIEAGATADQDLSNYVQDGGDAQLDSTGATDTLTVTKSGSGDAIDISNSGSGVAIRVNTDEFIVDGGVVDVKSDLNVGGVTTIKDEAVSTEANLLQVQSNDGTETFLGVRNGHVDILGELDIVHTAVAPDEHALEIDINADGNGDIKAVDIVYNSGAIGAGDDEAVILVNVDESAATGGDVTALEVLATEGSAQVNGMLAGINVNPVEQLSGTFGDMDSALVNATNRLTEFTTAGTDIEMFSADNDTVTIGNATKFEEIEFLFSTTASQTIRPTFEYSTGVGTWASFTPVDGTNGCRNNGVIVWLDGDIPSWAVGTGSEYLIRITRTRNALTTAPIESLVQIGIAEEYYWNKTGDIKTNSVTLDSTVTLKEQTSTPSTPASGYKAIYPKDNGKLYTLDDTGAETEVGSGSGSGGINYMEGDNFNAETTVGDWVEYADTALENPTDGVGIGATVTFTRNTTTPLRGDADFKLVKDAANRQGEGASCDFTIDKADQAQKLTISFDYDTSDADYADDDIRIAVYDVTNANLIRINGEDLKGGKGSHVAQFQAAADSTSYRLIFHVSSTNAAAYDLYFDNIQVGPREVAIGPAMSDWEEFNSTVSGTSNFGSNFLYRRVGDSIQVKGSIGMSGPASGQLKFTLPDGLHLDTNKLDRGVTYSNSYQILGSAIGRDSSPAGYYNGEVQRDNTSTNTFIILTSGDSGLNASWSTSVPIVWASGDNINVKIQAPIQGWSSNSKMSEDFGGRDVVVEANGCSVVTLTPAVTNIPFNITTELDTTASWDGGVFTAPETGEYIIACAVAASANNNAALQLYRNGSLYKWSLIPNSMRYKQFSDVATLEKGDTLSIRTNISFTTENSNDAHYIHIQKLASPQTILETETVAARYTTNAGQNNSSGAYTIVKYEDIDFDTHGSYDTSTGEYTISVSGKYHVNAKAMLTAVTADTGEMSLAIYINGTKIDEMYNYIGRGTLEAREVNSILDLTKDDIVTIRLYQTNGAGRALFNQATYNSFSIARIK